MDHLVTIDFHLHSNFSDGMFSPEILADELAAAQVRYAALTDHDTIDGLGRFGDAAASRGIQCVNGVEMSAERDGWIYHVLGYGFDSGHAALREELARNYAVLHPGMGAWKQKAKWLWCSMTRRPVPPRACLIGLHQALELIHDAGGRAFLAHPLTPGMGNDAFSDWLGELKQLGLDGLETYYKQYSRHQVRFLQDKVRQYGLMSCSGSDFHGKIRPRWMDPGLAVSREHLRQFCQVLNWDALDVTGPCEQRKGG